MKLCMMLPPRADKRWILARQMGVEFAIAKLAPELTDSAQGLIAATGTA